MRVMAGPAEGRVPAIHVDRRVKPGDDDEGWSWVDFIEVWRMLWQETIFCARIVPAVDSAARRSTG
jgi:hypothetical protein